MTTLLRLGIQGIRSFDENVEQVLLFDKPLTLIVGPNGAGKTTIIECLKMATTGELPPNAKNGHTFVHDPRLANAPEVKGRIRLCFVNAAGKKMTAARYLQLQNVRDKQGRIKPKFQQLDSVLSTKHPDGTPTSISHRCADMDQQVPQLMGVSKAILENVVFCHQEDSCWPLGEPKSLKDKFDDLFGATRYTKALDAINKLKKEQATDIKAREGEVRVLAAHLDQARKLRQQLQDCQERAEAMQAEAGRLDERILRAQEEVRLAQQEFESVQTQGGRLTTTKELRDKAREEIAEMRGELGEEFDESPEELRECLRNIEANQMHEIESALRTAEEELKALEDRRRQLLIAARDMRARAGEVAGSIDLLRTKREERVTRFNALKAKHSLGGVDTPERLVEALRQMLQGRTEAHAKCVEEVRSKERQYNEQCGELERTLTHLTAEVSGNTAKQQHGQEEISRLEQELIKISGNTSSVEALRSEVAKNEQALRDRDQGGVLQESEKRLEEIARRKHDLTFKVQRANEQVRVLEAQSRQLNEADFLRQQVALKEQSLQERLAEVKPLYHELVGSSIVPEHADTAVATELRHAQDLLGKVRTQAQQQSHKHSSIEARKRLVDEEVARLSADVERRLQLLPAESRNSEEVRRVIEAEATAKEGSRNQMNLLENADKLYRTLLDSSIKKNKCEFCKRPFHSPAELEEFSAAVQSRIQLMPEKIARTRQRFHESEQRLRELEALRPEVEHIARVQSDLPQRRAELERLNREVAEAQRAVDAARRELESTEHKATRLHELRRQCGELSRAATELSESKRQLAEKEASFVHGASGPAQTGQSSLQKERDSLNALHQQLQQLDSEAVAWQGKKDIANQQANALSNQLAQQKARLHVMQADIKRRAEVDERLSVLRSNVRGYDENRRLAQANLDSARQRLEKAREERDAQVRKAKARAETLEQECRELERQAKDVADCEASIRSLEAKVQNTEHIQDELRRADQEAMEQEEQVNRKKEQVADTSKRRQVLEEMRRNMKDNLKLKLKEEELQALERQIKLLQEQIGATDLDVFRRRVDEKRDTLAKLQHEKSRRQGEREQIEKFGAERQADLRNALYRNIDERHRHATIEHETVVMANKDLGRYHTALEKALMKYHSLKMAEINKSIKELWQVTYKGHDIEYVAIKADTDEDAAQTATQKNFNYRVVMVRSGTELDMRGRCSAGQKVLASIIIRLALAESFGLNCGILALDEPTTNLDKMNIEGLATALGNLVQERKANANFQLLLITHDQQFVDQLAKSRLCDFYYTVHKDDRGCSTISRKDITEWTG